LQRTPKIRHRLQKNGTAAAEQKPAAEVGASKTAGVESEKSASKDAATADKKPASEGGASKTAGAESEKSTSKDAADKKPEDAGDKGTAAAGQAPVDTAAKPATPEQPKPADAAKADVSPAPGAPESAKKEASEPAPAATAALPDASSNAHSAGVADQVLPPADPIVAGIRQRLPDAAKGANEDDVAALAAFYEELNGPAIWVSTSGLTAKGKAVVEEIGRADDWGLSASDFDVPRLASGELSPEAAADAELKVALAVLKYARYARGGRINPLAISAIIDQAPSLRPPKAVLADVAATDAPDAYLRSLHPTHVQFERLRQVLLKLRGTEEVKEEQPAEDPALSVKLPPGRVLRPGIEDPQVALLRQRLKVPAEAGVSENLYDDKLRAAVEAFQREKGLRPDAMIGNQTRALLNGRNAPPPEDRSKDGQIQRILVNMERWRWMPEDLGDFYVWDNVPEFVTRVVKNGKTIHTDKIIVGQPTWPTPSFSADMKTIVFHPSWGVPEGIKRKELLPLLRNSSGGFFGFFGGGYSSQAVLEAHELRAYYNGRPIDPNQVDWNSVNIANYSFQQPPSPRNVLGDVKFMFPNKHDVYMHDTPERNLFVKSFRALSHGCMRVEQPRLFAEILLAEDKGWPAEKVRGMFNGYSSEVQLEKHIPVHVTYFTALVEENGKVSTFGDVYGHDSRVAAALTGKSLRFEQPVYGDEDIVASDGETPGQRRPGGRKKQYDGPPTLADAITGLFSP
jgi:murein L,D-transpeptidase YcbB/YkuD